MVNTEQQGVIAGALRRTELTVVQCLIRGETLSCAARRTRNRKVKLEEDGVAAGNVRMESGMNGTAGNTKSRSSSHQY